jgi:lambda family phage portal protein
MSRIEYRQTIVDRIVSAISPQAGLARMHARARLDSAFGYEGGGRWRRSLKNFRPGQGSADADTLRDLPTLRGRSRDLARNAPIALGAISTTTTGVVGEGLKLQASIDTKVLGITPEQADEYEREQEREWGVFCATADFSRVQCFDELQQLGMRSMLESGDVFAIRRFRLDAGDVYGTKIQLIEADRVSNPNNAMDTDKIAGGVEADDGVPVAYHVSDRHPGSFRYSAMKWERVPARTETGLQTVLHVFERTRPELTRGVPFLAPVIEHIKQLTTYSASEVDAAVVSSFVTAVIETPAGEDGEPILGETDPSLAANEVKLGPGAVISLADGEKLTSFNPSRPNVNFDAFVKPFCREIGVALDLPVEMLLKSFTASYSASRAALEMAWMSWRRRRSVFAGRLPQPVYEWMMEEAVASGRLVRPGFFSDPVIRAAWCGALWIGPQRQSLNPYQEAQADALDIQTGAKTIEQVCMERTGGDFEKKNEQRAKEQAARQKAGLGVQPTAQTGASDGGDAGPQRNDEDRSDDEGGDREDNAGSTTGGKDGSGER